MDSIGLRRGDRRPGFDVAAPARTSDHDRQAARRWTIAALAGVAIAVGWTHGCASDAHRSGIRGADLSGDNDSRGADDMGNNPGDVASSQLVPVPIDFELRVEFSLRDLSGVAELTLPRGPEAFAVDAWVEGPLGVGETCSRVGHQRQGIAYVATVRYFMGMRAGGQVPHELPWYRGTDYLAALITAGVFSDLDGSSTRRTTDGHQAPGLMSGISEADMRNNIDCHGITGVDVCAAGRALGPQTLTWLPRARSGLQLAQGDYLFYLLLNLERDPVWVAANDFETCWDDTADQQRGVHRFVIPLHLGGDAHQTTHPQSAERAGPDVVDGSQLYYVDADGVTLTWGPGP